MPPGPPGELWRALDLKESQPQSRHGAWGLLGRVLQHPVIYFSKA